MAEENKESNKDTMDTKEEKKEKKNIVKAVKKDVASVKSDKSDKSDKQPVKPVKEKVKLSERLKKFMKDYRSELKKIVWPTRAQVVQNTGIVLIAIAFVAVVVGLLDLVFGYGITGLSQIKTLITGG